MARLACSESFRLRWARLACSEPFRFKPWHGSRCSMVLMVLCWGAPVSCVAGGQAVEKAVKKLWCVVVHCAVGGGVVMITLMSAGRWSFRMVTWQACLQGAGTCTGEVQVLLCTHNFWVTVRQQSLIGKRRRRNGATVRHARLFSCTEHLILRVRF